MTRFDRKIDFFAFLGYGLIKEKSANHGAPIPQNMRQVMLSIADVASALGIPYSAARRILRKPHPLPFTREKRFTDARGAVGGSSNMYELSSVLPRVKDHGFNSSPQITALFKKAYT